MDKIIKTVVIIAGVFLVGFLLILTVQQRPTPVEENVEEEDSIIDDKEADEKITDDFMQCLKEEGVVIYGSTTCPACSRLEGEYGGYEIVKPIYLDCSRLGSEEELARCKEEMKTGFVPEIQIKGELFDEWGSPETLAKETGCEL